VNSHRLHLALFLAIAVLAAFVRIPVLRQGLWEDEATAVYVAESPNLHEFLRRQVNIDYSPPLFNAILAAHGQIFGFGEVSVKSLAIGLGAIAAGSIALAAAEMFGIVGGLLAGLFAVEHRLLIDMSSEVRPYSLSAALAALSFWFVFRFQRRKSSGQARPWDLLLLGACLALTAMSHYAGTVVIGVVGLFSLFACIRKETRVGWRSIAGCSIFAGLVFLSWAPVALRQIGIGFPWAGELRPSSLRSIAIFKTFSLLPGMPAAATRWTILGIALAMGACLASSRTVREEFLRSAAPLALLALATAGAFFAVGLKAPPARYVTVPVALSMILLGGVVAIVGRGARRAGIWERRTALAAVLVMAGCALGRSLEERSQLAAVARAGIPKTIMRGFFRDGILRPGDLVIGAPDMIGPTLWYYAPPGVVVRGFVHWGEPAFENFGDYARLWPDPRIVGECLSALDHDVQMQHVRRVILLWAVGGDGALPFKTRTGQLRDGIRRRFPQESSTVYRGPGERIQIDVFVVTAREGTDPPARPS
jgi:Dolichyl-phosphate-mannose-protein mannosyltransferase